MSDPAVSPYRVTVEAVEVPFTRLVLFFIKAGLAAIPAALALMAIFMAIGFVLRAIFGFGPGYWHYY